MPKWIKMNDHAVRHVWRHECKDESCINNISKYEITVYPSFAQDSGIPQCEECESSLVYDRTEIDAEGLQIKPVLID